MVRLKELKVTFFMDMLFGILAELALHGFLKIFNTYFTLFVYKCDI